MQKIVVIKVYLGMLKVYSKIGLWNAQLYQYGIHSESNKHILLKLPVYTFSIL